MAWVRCPDCPGSDMKWFGPLTEEEIPAARQVVAEARPEEYFVANAYHRCRHEGCRRIQRRDDWKRGGTLPEEG
ncbi:hypothetical protein I2W78_26190 [Streptomyces spinoverrucosus]|uniref:hypothetical protein n=1 Tax=Streptomyces spinoverrucosus TaxID=284043 RepID=UPI0018C403FC|nr:hypothetical protein [Streptomyces spinoverrucosus]MBG0855243.1 hypothetical protein [Streptomyces spinoverrucosus]